MSTEDFSQYLGCIVGYFVFLESPVGQNADIRIRSNPMSLRMYIARRQRQDKQRKCRRKKRLSNIKIRYTQSVALDKLAPWLDLVAHQRGKQIARRFKVLDANLGQQTILRIDGGLP